MGAEAQSYLLARLHTELSPRHGPVRRPCRPFLPCPKAGAMLLSRSFLEGPPTLLTSSLGTSKQDLTSFNMELSSSGISADLSHVSGWPEAGVGWAEG